MKKIVLIDGHNLLFRMFYGIPSSIKNSKGKEIRGLVGFLGSLKKLIEEFRPYSLYVIFDSETSRNTNLELDQDYKATRKDYNSILEEDNPFTQLPLIYKALEYLNIPFLEVQNNEADDFIASIISHNNKEYEYIIVSTDTDFIQLINENVYMYVPRGKKSILYTKKEVINKYHIVPEKYITYKSLVGDKSDNIKGVKGIGQVSASLILNDDSLESYIKNNPNSRYTNLLLQNTELINKNLKLIEMNKTCDTSNIIFNKLSNTIIDYKTYEIIEMIGER